MLWAVRVLSGSQAGQIFPLHAGKHTVGRSPSCDIKIDSNSVSKEHISLIVTGDKVILTDLNSRNGTFVNGVRIQNQRLNLGDKISLHDILLDVLKVPEGMTTNRPLMPAAQNLYTTAPPAWAGNAALKVQHDVHAHHPSGHAVGHGQAHGQLGAQGHASNHHGIDQAHAASHPASSQASANSLSGLFYNFKIYIDNVAMPGVYSLAQSMSYRYALALLCAVYAFAVTALSTIPVVTTTKANIRQESVRRALTITRNMAATNRQAVIENNDLAMSVRLAELEEGVTTALIVSAKDGTILSPANKRGEFANKPFVQKARREEKELWQFIDDSNLGVSVPITFYSSESGAQSQIAYAVILYDLGALAMNSSQTLTLFFENLGIAFFVAALFYFFLFKLVENPVDVLNAKLDEALREGRDDLSTDYQYPALETLASNINSALSRIDQNGGGAPQFAVSRDSEATNLVRMLNSAAVTVNAIDDRVIATNAAFDKLVGGGVNLSGRSLTEIPDIALQENLRELLPRMRASVGEIALSEIPFAGQKYEICGQVVMGSTEPAYFVIVLNSLEASG